MCTADACDSAKAKAARAQKGAECVHTPITGGCDDGDPCTDKDACAATGGKQAGQCVGTPRKCDDGVACTVDVCDKKTGKCTASAEPDGGPCDDANPCTFIDACSKGVCVGEAKPCDDGLPCTADGCDGKGKCTHKALGNGALCDDGDPCTIGDICATGACHGGKQDCNDGDVCSVDTCDAKTGKCLHGAVADDTLCDDGNACTSKDRCKLGKCTGDDKDCSDGWACTLDTCNPVNAVCSTKPIGDGGGCDDGDPCTVQELCKDGACKGVPHDCDDGSPCTTDACDSKTGCVHKAVTGAKSCDDNNACTTGDACAKGVCAGKAKTCDDNNPCTADLCNATTGKCLHPHAGEGNPCDDGSKCTSGDRCVGGGCQGKLKSCGNVAACKPGSCDPATGQCNAAPKDADVCDDGNPCTHADRCKSGGCAGQAKTCDDGDPCTGTLCNALTGPCSNAAVSAAKACNDGNPCTTGDACIAGACKGQPKSCDDGKGCTADSCAPSGACRNIALASGKACDDGDKCTLQDTCAGDKCAGTKQLCPDGGPCTTGLCDTKTGLCATAPKSDGQACDDGTTCTADDKCLQGQCDGDLKDCDDDKPCTRDNCDFGTGKCAHQTLADGTACADDDPCTLPGSCKAGACKGLPNPCDDGNPCTDASCDKDGCKQAANKTRHIFAVNGYLNDTWFHRAFWIYGASWKGGCGGFGSTGNSNHSGRIMISDGQDLYAYGRSKYGWGSAFTYNLYKAPMGQPVAAKTAAPAPAARRGRKGKKGNRSPKARGGKSKRTWSVDIPVLARSIIKSGDKLIVAGPRKLYDENAAILELEDAAVSDKIAAQAESWNKKADLLVISAADGKVIKTINFDFAPVWDGIAVAEQALFVSGTNGVLYRLQ